MLSVKLFLSRDPVWSRLRKGTSLRNEANKFRLLSTVIPSLSGRSREACPPVFRLNPELFPLCFLFLMVPIPKFALNWIVEFLQQQSAVAARLMFRAAGVPVTQDGIMLSIPGLDIEVARECSSIRSSLMLVVTTLVLAHLFLRSWWRKVLLVAAAIPLSVAKNGLRIFTIVELGTRVDPGFLKGKLHHHGGIIFFGLGGGCGGALRRMGGSRRNRVSPDHRHRGSRGRIHF